MLVDADRYETVAPHYRRVDTSGRVDIYVVRDVQQTFIDRTAAKVPDESD